MTKRRSVIYHVLSVFLLLGSVAIGMFVQKIGYIRLVEACRDFGTSVGIWFCTVFGIENSIPATVGNASSVSFADIIDFDFESFKNGFSIYGRALISTDNLVGYIVFLFDAVEVSGYRKSHYRAVTLEEQCVLLNSIKNPLYYAVFNILFCTGLRIGEFLALDSQCAHFADKYISVSKSVDIHSGQLQNRTKTYTSVRKVPFLKELVPHLKFLFAYQKENGRMTYNQIKKYFQKLLKKIGINGINLHSFRHTYGCMCYRAGLRDKTIQRLMGHASLDVTMNTYVDVMGSGFSPLNKYFEEYKKEVENRPTDFWLKSVI